MRVHAVFLEGSDDPIAIFPDIGDQHGRRMAEEYAAEQFPGRRWQIRLLDVDVRPVSGQDVGR